MCASPGASLRSRRRTHATPAKPAPTTRILGRSTVTIPSRVPCPYPILGGRHVPRTTGNAVHGACRGEVNGAVRPVRCVGRTGYVAPARLAAWIAAVFIDTGHQGVTTAASGSARGESGDVAVPAIAY